MRVSPVDSSYAWLRLLVSLGIATVGSAGMYAVVVVLPAFQADFNIGRGGASIPYTMVMAGFGFGGLIVTRIVDRYGIVRPLLACSIALGLSYIQAGLSTSLVLLSLAHIQIGAFGCAIVFAPLLADISKWFTKRRGLAIAICACGNYLAGTLWPPVMQSMVVDIGWRETYFFIGILSTGLMFPLVFFLNRKPNASVSIASGGSEGSSFDLGLTPNKLAALLCVAGVACCIAMAMPQVHLVALCGDRGYGPAVGAQMLSLMLACGLVSRLGFGWLSDRLGGLMTLLIGSSLQCLALVCFLGANSLISVYAVSMMFGLFQGGIVPSYALVVREFFPEVQAASRLGVIILATVFGMAFGGWISGAIYDYTDSYQIAFAHGAGWNLVNMAIILMLLMRSGRLKSLTWSSA